MMSLRARAGLFVGSMLLAPLVLGPAGAAEAAGGQVCMGVVIDDGPNSPDPNWSSVPVVQGATVNSGTSDLEAMTTVGETPTQNDSGLVCAISNYPSNGLQNCLNASGGQFFYWSYWEGDPYTNTWTYASVGPASHTVSSGQTYVEGWRYQDPGADNPSATKPSVTPSAAFARACPGVAPVPSGSTGGGTGGGGAPGGGSPAGPQSSSGPSTTPSAAAAPAATQTTSAGATGGGAVTTTTPPSSARPIPSPSHTTTSTSEGGATSKSDAKSTESEATLASSSQHRTSGGGDPTLPIVVVAGVILLLGGLAWWRWHRRPVEE